MRVDSKRIRFLLGLVAFTLSIGFIIGLVSKGKIDSLLPNFNLGGSEKIGQSKVGTDQVGGDKGIGNDKVGRDKTSGDKTDGDKVGNDKVGRDQYKENNGFDTLKAESGSNVQIVIRPGDPKYDNKQQPNVAYSTLADVQPVELGQFKGANPFTLDLVLSDYNRFIVFESTKIAISDRIYSTLFRLQGDSKERKVVFSLSGNQKGIFLQFGLKDLSEKSDNLIYDVTILLGEDTSIKKVWSGRLIYGAKEQILSLPFDAKDAKSLVIKYFVSQGNTNREIFFTRAELLYN